jgi:DNA mismatch repair protein MSH5
MNGVDASVVARADEITDLLARGENVVAACAKIPQRELEELEEAVWMQRNP